RSEIFFFAHQIIFAWGGPRLKPPKCFCNQKSQREIETPKKPATAPTAGIAGRSFPARASTMHHHEIAPRATKISGRLLSFVRYAAAIDKPVAIPRKMLGLRWENHLARQMNTSPKQIGEKTSLPIP